jgi:hypothetical protein
MPRRIDAAQKTGSFCAVSAYRVQKVISVFKNKNESKNNICGEKISMLRNRMNPYVSQRALAEKMQLIGIDLDKNAVQRVECGNRFVTDIELRAFAGIFNVSADFLISDDKS